MYSSSTVGENNVIDEKTLPRVKTPNREKFAPDPRPEFGEGKKTSAR